MKNRVVVITGATGKIGKELSFRFGGQGYRVGILFHKNRGAAHTLAEKIIQNGMDALPVQTDVRSLESLDGASEMILKKWSRVDTLICSAGIRRDSLIVRTSEIDWEETMAVNLKGVWNSLRVFGKGLAASETGHAIVIGSAAGVHARAGQAAYVASKAGLIGLVRSAAREWTQDGIRVNLVFPGFHPGGVAKGLTPKQETMVMGQNLLKQSPTISEAAESIFRISEFSTVTGQIFNLDSRIF